MAYNPVDLTDPKIAARFWRKVEKKSDAECWPWLGRCSIFGYGTFDITGTKTIQAHRMGYKLAKGDIPNELVVDHMCRQRNCCNPSHLQAITSTENILLGVGAPAMNARKTHCKRGHPLSGDNLFLSRKGERTCRQCKRASWRQYDAKRKAKIAAEAVR